MGLSDQVRLSGESRKAIGWVCIFVFLVFLVSPVVLAIQNYPAYFAVMLLIGCPLLMLGVSLMSDRNKSQSDIVTPAEATPRHGRVQAIAFWVIVILLSLYIFGLTIYHGSESPFNTLSGKLAFMGIFVGFPSYLFLRVSRLVGFVAILAGAILWTLGLSILVSAGVNPNSSDSLGETALHKASEYGRLDTIELLLELGADPSIKEMRGELPVEQALPRKSEQVKAIFDGHTATNPTKA